MRFRQMATYRGVPYEVGVGPSESDVVLFAACPPPEELGFEPAPGHWRKRVIRAEVDVLWESRPIGTFHGEACLVLDDLGDRLHIVYLGKDARRARELGYWQVDRGVFELLTPRDEVTSLTEEKVEKNLPRSRPEPTAPPQPSYPYGAQPWPAAPPAAPAPAGARGRGYPEPAMTPAGAWTGNGAPPQWTGNGTGGHPAPGYGAPGGQPGWAGPGTGPQPPVTGPQPPVSGPQPPVSGPQPSVSGPQPPVSGPQPPVSGYGAPAGWTGNGTPGGTGSWTGNGTGGHPAPHWTGNGTPVPPGGWNGPGAPPPAGWSGNGAPPPGWTGPGTGPQPPVGGYGPPATWTGNGAPGGTGSWTGNGAAGMNGHGPVNGNGTGQWNGAATMQAPPAGPNGILDGTPLAGPPRRAQAPAGGRSARKRRVQTRSIFSELADLAAIPRSAYALEQEADGAMCLLRTDEGFEVFSAADGARHEVRTFEDEEAAYFYLFGVLAAEAVRNGSLIPPR